MTRTKFVLASGLTAIFLTSPAAIRAQEIVIQAPYVTVRVGTGGSGGVDVDVPFFHLRVPPKMKGAPRGVMPKLEQLPPPLPNSPPELQQSSGADAAGNANGASSSTERIPPGMLPPPVPIPTDDDDVKPRREQLPPPAEPKQSKEKAPREEVPPPETPRDASPAPRSLSLADFAKGFEALAGTHEITIMHPVTKQPVNVRFTLPAEALRRVHVGRHEIEFKYKNSEVRIRFKHDGTVKVEDRD